MTQTIIALAIVSLAVIYTIFAIYKIIKRKNKKCCGCSNQSELCH